MIKAVAFATAFCFMKGIYKFGFMGEFRLMVGDGALDIPHIGTRTETLFDAQMNTKIEH